MIDPRLVPRVAERFKMLGDPGRLSVLAVLQDGEKNVSEIVRATRRSQPSVSRNLSQLSRAGIVSGRREGSRVYYSIADRLLSRLCEVTCASLAAHAREEARALRGLASGAGRARA